MIHPSVAGIFFTLVFVFVFLAAWFRTNYGIEYGDFSTTIDFPYDRH